MKLPYYQAYRPEDTERCEQALLSVWAKLRDYAEDLVLIGGLVPRYLCVDRPAQYPAQTLDVDLGIALGASAGLYEPISVRLSNEGFNLKKGTARFERAFGKVTLHVDFLTTKDREDDPDARMVDDVPAQAVLGLDRAVKTATVVPVSGRDLNGASVTEAIRVCAAGPFVVLKLVAYGGRAEGKDVFDAIRFCLDHRDGYETAIQLFHAEAGVNNAHAKAQSILVERFSTGKAKGVVVRSNVPNACDQTFRELSGCLYVPFG